MRNLTDGTAAAEEPPVTASIDPVGNGYVELAIELGISNDRIDTVVDFRAIEKYGVKSEGGAKRGERGDPGQTRRGDSGGASSRCRSSTYPVVDVREAFAELDAGHIAGKIVLIP